ncbi:MAG: S41 family peptidase [Tepidiformaceae bacterium]
MESQPGAGERAARSAVLVFMLLAVTALAFGLGYLINEVRDDGDSTAAVPGSTTFATGDDAVGAAILDEIYDLLKTNHVDRATIDPDSIRDAAISGAIASLNDPHTQYIPPQDVAAVASDLSSSYQGIGASVSDQSGEIQIISPFRGSPAEDAGIRPGDVVLEVDGEKTDGWSDQQAVRRIRGLKGTTVVLTIRHTDGTTETITITRGDIEIESVFTVPNLEVIPGESGEKIVDRDGNPVTDIGFVAISGFHDKTLSELRTKIGDIERKGYKALIVDLRSNPGGQLLATLQVADEFLAGGTILHEVDAAGKKTTETARPGGIATKIPLVILLDRSSASASEVLAAALRDNGRARIVGTRSFGKGTVNQLQPLKNCGDPAGCGALYISVGRWLSPKGDQIEGLGVKPDFEVPMTAEEYIDQGDIQMFRAVEVARGN